MASKAAVAKFKKRKNTIKSKEASRVMFLDDGNVEKIRKMTSYSYPSQLRNRCEVCGRSRGYIRRLKMCRICARKAALNGELPGIKKLSW